MSAPERCENCHSNEIYNASLQLQDENGIDYDNQNPIRGTYCVDCGVFEQEDPA